LTFINAEACSNAQLQQRDAHEQEHCGMADRGTSGRNTLDRNTIDHNTWAAHPHLAWAMWGLDEIEATLASLESHFHKHADVGARVGAKSENPTVASAAAGAMADIRGARDAFRESIETRGPMTESDLARSKAGLQGQWLAFEDSLEAYLDTLGKQIAEQETVFRARADAQGKAWQQAIDRLHDSAARLDARRRGEVEAAVRRLEAEADASKAKLHTLNKAEGTSWTAMKSALTDTRAALERANHAVHDAFVRSA
jgi:hypothetical protein